MVRIDVWDLATPEESVPIDLGFPRDLAGRYDWGRSLGKGGFGRVTIVIEKISGTEYACKTISKLLDVPNFSPQKQAAHLDNVKREIAVLRRLRGTLNVAQIKEALEDDESVHIIMEFCKGGELWNCIGKRHYSEQTVASFMRAVLRTVTQCHMQRILHRDVKPGNFMLLEDDPLSPVKAIDFGLAVFFDPSNLPRRDLGLEGTPWFMSPETLSSEVGPPSDVWAAGVMAFQLLSGFLPFDDHRNRDTPSLSKIWKAILTEEVSFKFSVWQEVSQPAKDFVSRLLQKEEPLGVKSSCCRDPKARPLAKEALQHPWLAGGHKEDRNLGTPLRHNVVQRIQRYGQSNVLKRTIFELIAQEIIKMAPDTPDPSHHSRDGATIMSPSAGEKREADGGSEAGGSHTMQLVNNIKRRKSARALAVLAHGPGGGAMEGPPLIHRDHHSVHAGMQYFAARGESVHNGQQALQLSREARSSSVHGQGSYWQLMAAAATALKWQAAGDWDSRQAAYLRLTPRCQGERDEQRKASRLALDTSAHASPEYQKLLQLCSSSSSLRRGLSNGRTSNSEDSNSDGRRRKSEIVPAKKPTLQEHTSLASVGKVIPDLHSFQGEDDGEQQVRGRHAYRQFLSNGNARSSLEYPRSHQNLEASRRSHSFQDIRDSEATRTAAIKSNPTRPHSFELPAILRAATTPGGALAGAASSPVSSSSSLSLMEVEKPKKHVSFSHLDEALHVDEPSKNGVPEVSGSSGSRRASKDPLPGFGDVTISEMKELMRNLNFTREAEGVSEAGLAEGLRRLGYQLRPAEVGVLTDQLAPLSSSRAISKSAFLASQLDWHSDDFREMWIEAAKKVFADLDKVSEGKVSSSALLSLLQQKVPEAEVEYAVEDALVEAGYADEEEMDFEGFLRILRADSLPSLDQFEARRSSHENLTSLAVSPPAVNPLLPPVAEEP